MAEVRIQRESSVGVAETGDSVRHLASLRLRVQDRENALWSSGRLAWQEPEGPFSGPLQASTGQFPPQIGKGVVQERNRKPRGRQNRSGVSRGDGGSARIQD